MTNIDKRAIFESLVQHKSERFQPDFSRFGDHPDADYRFADYQWAWELCQAYAGRAVMAEAEPVNMVLMCPYCGLQHIDEPHGNWLNPPHRSHECQGCGFVWRVADVPTNGVRNLLSSGKSDSAPVDRANVTKNYCDCRQGRDPCTCKSVETVGRVEVLAQISNKFGDPEAFAERDLTFYKDVNRMKIGTELVDRAHVTRLQSELTKLGDDYCKRVDELIKARDLVLRLANAGSQASGFPSNLMREARVYLTKTDKENI